MSGNTTYTVGGKKNPHNITAKQTIAMNRKLNKIQFFIEKQLQDVVERTHFSFREYVC